MEIEKHLLITSSSETSWKDAITTAISEASKTIDYLTETDKIAIENGIRVNGLEELNQLIEDFE